MKQLLTSKNIVIAVLVIGVVILLIILFSQRKEPVINTTAIEMLQKDLEILKQENTRLEEEGEAWRLQSIENRKRDSLLLRDYQARVNRDRQTIENLKKQRDEKHDIIDRATDSLLNDILSKE